MPLDFATESRIVVAPQPPGLRMTVSGLFSTIEVRISLIAQFCDCVNESGRPGLEQLGNGFRSAEEKFMRKRSWTEVPAKLPCLLNRLRKRPDDRQIS